MTPEPKKKAVKPLPKSPQKPSLILGICFSLAAIVWIVFGQAREFDFVNIDDGRYITSDPAVTGGVTASGIASAFNVRARDNWMPLTTISHMVDCQLYGLKPSGHHVTNVLLHATATILLFLALRRMTGKVWRSALVAAVFAVHPLRAESVAWVTERKDVLCGVFFMLTLLTYAWYTQNPRPYLRYLAALLSAGLALLSKPAAVTLPLVLLLLDYWPLNRLNRSNICRLTAEKVPFLVLSIASCLPTIFTQQQAMTETTVVSNSLRIENAIVSYAVYIREFFLPANLAIFYRYSIEGLPFAKVAGAFIFLGAVTGIVFYARRKHPFLLAGWLWYLVVLLPMIGLVQVGSQAHADRYTYLPEIGLCLMLVWLAADWCIGSRERVLIGGGLCAALLAVLIWDGRNQVGYWRNSQTLWSHALACDPDDVRAYNNLGHYFDQKGDLDGAITNYQNAIRIDPGEVSVYMSLGKDLITKGDADDGIAQYRAAIQRDPGYAVAHYNLGSALLQRGDLDNAIIEFRTAIGIDPAHSGMQNNPDLAMTETAAKGLKMNYALFHYGLGLALEQKGQLDEAIAQYQETLKLDPNYSNASYLLTNALLKKANVETSPSEQELKTNSSDARSYNNLGITLHKQGKVDEAIVEYQKALKINPDYAQAHYNLGNALFEKGQVNEAILQYEAALKIMPGNPMLQRNLAHTIWLLATSSDATRQNGTNAVAFAQTANQLAGSNNPLILRALAAADAESGNYSAAVDTARQALMLATEQGNVPLENALPQEISLYQNSKAMRADPNDMRGW